MEDDLIPLDIIDDFLSEQVSDLLDQPEALFEPNLDPNIGNSSNFDQISLFLLSKINVV